ncbi:MAG: sugar transferase [Nitrospira sp. CR1.2]|nr:sugar transferase [Nitrospira sp. CR1.2]
MIKRLVDILGASLGLVLFSPLLLILAALIKLDSSGPVLFRQERIGRGFTPFLIYKFRTMAADRANEGLFITSRNDARVTRAGRWLRAMKLDELPQLLNVLIGDMSLVGPRPEVRHYVELFRSEYEQLLSIRPGMTDLASLKYRDEGDFLAQAEDPEAEYVTRILPDKIELGSLYLQRASLLFDLSLILKTVLRLVWPSKK